MKEIESGCCSLCLIDYEYCAYNYRGFDIANHFVEWTYDYTNPNYPYYTVNRELFPTKDQQVNIKFLNKFHLVLMFLCCVDYVFEEIFSMYG